MATLRTPTGAEVTVADGRVDALLAQGFTRPPAKQPAKPKKATKPTKD